MTTLPNQWNAAQPQMRTTPIRTSALTLLTRLSGAAAAIETCAALGLEYLKVDNDKLK